MIKDRISQIEGKNKGNLKGAEQKGRQKCVNKLKHGSSV